MSVVAINEYFITVYIQSKEKRGSIRDGHTVREFVTAPTGKEAFEALVSKFNKEGWYCDLVDIVRL